MRGIKTIEFPTDLKSSPGIENINNLGKLQNKFKM